MEKNQHCLIMLRMLWRGRKCLNFLWIQVKHWLHLLILVDFLWVISDVNEANVKIWITQWLNLPFDCLVVSLPQSILLSCSSASLTLFTSIMFLSFHLHHLIIKHPRLHFLKWTDRCSAKLNGLFFSSLI